MTPCASQGSSQSHPGTVQNCPWAFLGGAYVRAVGFAVLPSHLKIGYGIKMRTALPLMKAKRFLGKKIIGSDQLQVQMQVFRCFSVKRFNED